MGHTRLATAQVDIAPGRISLSGTPGTEGHRVTPADIVTRRELLEVRLSPHGRNLAFLVRQAFLDSNDYRYAIFIARTDGKHTAQKLVEGTGISQIRWSADAATIWFLASWPGASGIMCVDITANLHAGMYRCGGVQIPEGLAVTAFELSSSGRRIAVAGSLCPSAAARQRAAQEGVLYKDDRMSLFDLVERSWVDCPSELWIIDLASRHARRVLERPDDIGSLAWSPDEAFVAISYAAPPLQEESTVFFNRDIGLVAVETGAFTTLARGEGAEDDPTWSPDGQRLAFASTGSSSAPLGIVDIGSSRLDRSLQVGRGLGRLRQLIGWDDESRLVVEAVDSGSLRRGKSGLYSVSLTDGAVSEISANAGHVSACHLSPDNAAAACILQAPMSLPAPALVDLAQPLVRRVASLNPEWGNLVLGEVQERSWTNSYGARTNGFLVKPVGYKPGKRYPLLVMLYHFEGKFLSDAEWITSYPVQSLAGDGFAVLLVNPPQTEPWSGKNFAVGSIAEGYSPLASIRRGVDMLVREGIADSKRVGVLGWSYGAFLAEFALTQSDIFRVASVGNGGDYNPGTYWIVGNRFRRERDERVMGGPPFGRSYPNWLQFSPALNAHRARAPVLMEFSLTEAFNGLEMSSALRRRNVPVEFVVYPDEGHILTGPRQRLSSMIRNREWFNFWLQNRETDDPERREQYHRWREMRARLGGAD